MITARKLTANFADAMGGALATTASVSPTPLALLLLAVSARNGNSINPSMSSIAGTLGLTFVQIGSGVVFDDNSTSRRSLMLFRAMPRTAVTGTVAMTFSETETEACWSLVEFNGVDTSGDAGSGAIVQSATNLVQSTATTQSGLIVTLPAAFKNSMNASYGAFAEQGTGAGFGVGTGFTLLDNVPDTVSTGLTTFTEWKNSNDTTVDVTTAGSFNGMGGIAVEIKAAQNFFSMFK